MLSTFWNLKRKAQKGHINHMKIQLASWAVSGRAYY